MQISQITLLNNKHHVLWHKGKIQETLRIKIKISINFFLIQETKHDGDVTWQLDDRTFVDICHRIFVTLFEAGIIKAQNGKWSK